MVCRPFNLGNGFGGFVCTRGERQPRCKVCGKTAGKICDFPIIGKGKKNTCDAKLCDACATEIDPERLPKKFIGTIPGHDKIEVCPAHLRFIEKKES